MRKKFLFLFCTLFLLGVMAGCSEDPKEELESYQKDFRENVIEPVHEINLELTTALNSFNDGDANDEEVVLSLSEDLLNLIEEKRERSEEHTSELQSRGHLVCRLLLEKKKILTVYAIDCLTLKFKAAIAQIVRISSDGSADMLNWKLVQKERKHKINE